MVMVVMVAGINGVCVNADGDNKVDDSSLRSIEC